MKWSDRQLAIFDAYENTRKNIAIEATAGSSKTTCIVECCRRTPPNKKVLFMAFNKSIAEELRERLPSHIDVNTFHSKGLRVLLSNFRIKPKINENKCFVIGKKILETKDMDVKQQIRYLFEIQIIFKCCNGYFWFKSVSACLYHALQPIGSFFCVGHYLPSLHFSTSSKF